MHCRIIVTALIEKDGTFLFGQKPKDVGPYPNTWHLLGGGINPGEPAKDALKREIMEEAGIEITDIERVSFDEDYEEDKHGEKTHYIFLVFRAKASTDQVRPSDDIKELKWIHKSDLSNHSLTRPSVKLFKELGYF